MEFTVAKKHMASVQQKPKTVTKLCTFPNLNSHRHQEGWKLQ